MAAVRVPTPPNRTVNVPNGNRHRRMSSRPGASNSTVVSRMAL